MTIAHPAPPNTRESTRERRAIALYRERHHEIEQIGEDTYLVPACSARGGFYKVDYDAETCTCPDAEFHPEESCKHVLMVGILRAKRRTPRTYSEHVEAARRDAATEYREEIRALMRAGKL
jgi:hypothetical protein